VLLILEPYGNMTRRKHDEKDFNHKKDIGFS